MQCDAHGRYFTRTANRFSGARIARFPGHHGGMKKPKTSPRKTPAAPVRYSAALAERICERLAGGESLKAICGDAGYPKAHTVLEWARSNKEGFSDQYARAREIGYTLLADEIIEISDRPSGSLVNGGTDTGDVAHRRLQVDSRKWMLSKMLPKVYGEKQQIEHSGTIDTVATLLAARKRSGL